MKYETSKFNEFISIISKNIFKGDYKGITEEKEFKIRTKKNFEDFLNEINKYNIISYKLYYIKSNYIINLKFFKKTS